MGLATFKVLVRDGGEGRNRERRAASEGRPGLKRAPTEAEMKSVHGIAF